MNSKEKMKNVQLSFILLQIAFCNFYVMDNGETAVGTGARAKHEYRGLGITAQVKQASLRAARTNFPQLKIEVQVAADSAFFKQYTKPNPKRWKIIYKRVSINLTSLVMKVVNYFPSDAKTFGIDISLDNIMFVFFGINELFSLERRICFYNFKYLHPNIGNQCIMWLIFSCSIRCLLMSQNSSWWCMNKDTSLNPEVSVKLIVLLLLELSSIFNNYTAASSFIGPSGEDVRKGWSAYSTWCHLWGQTDLATKTPELGPFSWKQIRYLQQQTSIQSHL